MRFFILFVFMFCFKIIANEFTTYVAMNHPKAQGIDFRIDYPKDWIAQEGKRPNIIHFFCNQTRLQNFTVLIKQIEGLEPVLSKEDTSILLDSYLENIKRSSAFDSIEFYKKVKLEQIPALLYVSSGHVERLNKTAYHRNLSVVFFFQGKIILLQGTVYGADSQDAKIEFEKVQRRFYFMANSFILTSKWKN